MSMQIGIVGKPNVGKSTFFSAATLAAAEIASYPFTTIDANIGVGYVRAPCPHVDFGVQCNPHNSRCEEGTRLVPVELIDVAGLVPDAHKGKGLGNKFLDDLRQASALIHIVDASGSTDAEGNPCEVGVHEPVDDVEFLEREIGYWIAGIIEKGWSKISRQVELDGKNVEKVLYEKLTGLGITEAQLHTAYRHTELDEKPTKWGEEDVLRLAVNVQKFCKPIIIAANKSDIASDEYINKLKSFGETRNTTVIPTSAECELALRRAAKSGLISYVEGSTEFAIVEENKLNEKQLKALEKISNIIKRLNGSGVQRCIETAAYDTLDLIVVYPVEDETHLTDKEDRVLPDAYLMKRKSTARDLAYKVHTDLGDNFIRAIDARTHRVIGHDHELKNGDVIKIVAKA